jgi:trimeric autotransporter adhesin
MKKSAIILVLTLLTLGNLAQASQGITHPAVIRNTANEPVINSTIGIKVSIIQGSAEGTVAYSEIHTPLSNANGLISFEIGYGTVVSGSFANIDWANGPYFLKTEADPDGGTNYTISGTSQILSVPYALFAKQTAGSAIVSDSDGDTYIDPEATPDDDMIRFYNQGIETYRFTKKHIQILDPDLNVLIGSGTGINLIAGTGVRNTFIGFQAGLFTTEGKYNTFTGYKAVHYNTTGEMNTFYGDRAGLTNSEGVRNTFIGYYAGYSNSTGLHNTFLGYSSGSQNQTGSRNTFLGYLAGHKTQSGNENVFVGSFAGFENLVNQYNTAVGYHAGSKTISDDGVL